ncbi:LysR family transcriptional regulator [Oceanospirillum sanctuarii]|uniref:LysR family transcriptional regulator n=1 Tax=Oceanospirillum sanctuarii TaxID=1434821 RepID=UPI000A3861B8|nr:LysR family transcriptional regulator [Oceanospirillum sanctuarii]
MDHRLNLKHLHYFWLIAKTGSITKASEQLGLTPQTLSSQLATFEQDVGILFTRKGKRLELTARGKEIKESADDIFILVEELNHKIKESRSGHTLTLTAGMSASIHKLTAYQLLEPAMQLPARIRLKCLTGHPHDLLRALQQKKIDILFTDQKPAELENKQLFCHLLFATTLSLYAAESLDITDLRENFPKGLSDKPFLVNDLDAPYFSELHTWLKHHGVKLQPQLEVNDSALIKVFGHHGYGIFAAPSNISHEVCRQYDVVELGAIESIQLPHYMITRTPTPLQTAAKEIFEYFISS